MATQNKAVRFDRVSSEDQRDGFSLEAQKRLGDEYARVHKLKIIKSWSVDESASKEDDRKHFNDMIEFVKNNNVQDVIFDKVDRACRGLKSGVVIEELIDQYGVKFHFTREHLIINCDSPPQEKLRLSLGIVLGKYYIDNLKTEIKKGLDARLEAGLWNGLAPFGYKNTRIGSSGKAVIILDDIEAPVVKGIFELYSTGNYTFLDLSGVVNKRIPESKSGKGQMERMLINPFYYGMMKVKGKIVKGVHEPIIDKKLFDACMKIKGIRGANHHSARKGVIPKPFMGFLKCGMCDHAVTGESVLKASGKIYIYYRCANNKCNEHKKRITQDDLFKQLVFAFEPLNRWTPKATEAFIQNMYKKLQDIDLYTQKLSGELASDKLELKKRIEKLDQLRLKGLLTDAEYEAATSVSKRLMEEKIMDMDTFQSADMKTFEKGSRIIQLFQKAYEFMQIDGNSLEKIKLAKVVLSNPVLRDRTIEYNYKKPLDVLLPFTERPIWWRCR